MAVLLIDGTRVSGEDYKLSWMTRRQRRRYLLDKQRQARQQDEIAQYDEIVLDELRANGIL